MCSVVFLPWKEYRGRTVQSLIFLHGNGQNCGIINNLSDEFKRCDAQNYFLDYQESGGNSGEASFPHQTAVIKQWSQEQQVGNKKQYNAGPEDL